MLIMSHYLYGGVGLMSSWWSRVQVPTGITWALAGLGPDEDWVTVGLESMGSIPMFLAATIHGASGDASDDHPSC